jgi:hypothetical protein
MVEKLKNYFSRLQLSSNKKDRMVIYFGCFLVCLLVYVVFTAGFDSLDLSRANLNDKRDLYSWM